MPGLVSRGLLYVGANFKGSEWGVGFVPGEIFTLGGFGDC